MSMTTLTASRVRIEGCGKTFADGTRALEPVDLDMAAARPWCCSARRAAARPRCCASSPGWKRPTPAGASCSTAPT